MKDQGGHFSVGAVTPFIKRYRTPRVLLTYRYRDMRARVNGKVIRGGRTEAPWLGLPLMERDTFIRWTLENPEFQERFAEWESERFVRAATPTAHRIDRSRGYTFDNISWRRHDEKSREHINRA